MTAILLKYNLLGRILKWQETMFRATVLMLFLVCSVASNSQNGSYVLGHPASGGTAVLGTHNNSGITGVTPFLSSRKDSRSQYLYLADELTGLSATSGYISSIAFNITQIPANVTSLTNVSVSIGTTTSTSFPANLPAQGIFPVYKTITNLPLTATGWITIDLDTDFYWNGTDHIIVEICKHSTTAVASAVKVQTTQFTSDRTRGLFTNINTNAAVVHGCEMEGGASSTNNVATISPSTNRRYRPDIKFTFACSGTPSPAGTALILNAGSQCSGESVLLGVSHGAELSRLEYQWESTESLTEPFVAISGADGATMQAPKLEVDKYYRRKTGCGGSYINSSPVMVPGVNTWTGSAWSKGEPSPSESVMISGDFTPSSDVTFCSLTVNSGTLIIESGRTLTLSHNLKVNGGSVIFCDGSTLLQLDENAVNSGNITYQRKSQPVRRLDFTYWGSPVNSQVLNQFSPQTLADKYFAWNIASQNWYMESPTGVMTPGKGYAIRAPQTFAVNGEGTIFTGNFIGVPNNGDVQVPVVGNGLFNLIGNPYPGSVSAIEFLSDIINQPLLDGTLYFWTHNTSPIAMPEGSMAYSGSDYAMFNFTGGLGSGSAATSLGNNSTPNGFIGAGQSFMIKGTAHGTARFKNYMRAAGNNSQFFKTTGSEATPQIADFERNRLYLELTNSHGQFKQILVGYVTGATNSFERGYDGLAMEGAEVSFYSVVDSVQLAIQGRSLPFVIHDEVKLGYKATVAGSHLISLFDYDGLFIVQDVFLEDKLLGIIHNLKEGNYEFATTAGTFEDRFVIRYADTALGNEDHQTKASSYIIYGADKTINIDGGIKNIAAIEITDVNGRILYTKSGINAPKMRVDAASWRSGMLIIRITSEQNAIFVRKFIL